jgi:pyridinium-3,5-biscarboxylic acid mononucleotide sulfurtransferase
MLTQTIPASVAAKEDRLKALLADIGSLAIAYSGGVDSAYLSAVAHEALGDNARLILADSPSIPRAEVRDARALAESRGWNLTVIETTEFENEAFLKNDGTRCYHCKTELFTQMDTFAKAHDVAVLAYGEIAEDQLDPTRLGARAAREHAVIAPLATVGLEKEEIRRLSRFRELPTWNKASFACLSSRFPTGTRVVPEEVVKVEEAEEVLKALGFQQYRARHHGSVCRVEIDPSDFSKLLDEGIRQAVIDGINQAGYRYVTLDLAGYRTGSTADMPDT